MQKKPSIFEKESNRVTFLSLPRPLKTVQIDIQMPVPLLSSALERNVPDLPAQHQRGHQAQSNPLEPTTILLFTWADAGRKHVQKYVDGYSDLYPTAQITVVTATTVGTFFGGQNSARRVVRKVITGLFDEMQHNQTNTSSCTGNKVNGLSTTDGHLDQSVMSVTQRHHNSSLNNTRLLVHVFSNSGALNLEAACSVWNELQSAKSTTTGQSPQPLPIRAFILDSTPGGSSFRREVFRWTTGIATGIAPRLSFLPRLLAQFVAYIMGGMLVLMLMGMPRLFGQELMAARCRRAFNTAEDIPVTSSRLYIYSDSDTLIGSQDVESHAKEAEELGYGNVELEMFRGIGHVQHMRSDPKRYWSAITRCVGGLSDDGRVRSA